MPQASYNSKSADRGEAARGILGDELAREVAGKNGVPVDQLLAISTREQEAKAADHEQRLKQAEARSRQTVFDDDYAKIRREYTVFRQRRESRKLELQAPEHQTMLSALTADYSRKVQVERVSKEGQTTSVYEESEAAADRLTEITNAVSAVLAHELLVKSFTLVEYGKEALETLHKEALRLLVEQKEIEVVRREAEAATQREHTAVTALNELWKVYGPQLRRAGESNPKIKAFLTKT